jgi:putative peptidoglycan lipid II flippase
MLQRFSKIFPKWLEKKQTSILSAAFVITLANIIASISGLIRQRSLISIYFAKEISKLEYESFLVAFQIPDLMFQLIVLGALSASFIPIFTKAKKKSEKEAFQIANSVITVTVVFFIVISIIMAIFAKPITTIRTGDQFSQHQINTCTNLTRIMLVAQIFFCFSFFLSGILQTYQYFIIPAIAPIFYNVGIILGTYFFNKSFGIYGAGIGVIIGSALHLITQIPLAKKIKFSYRPRFDFHKPEVKKILSLIPARTLTIGISEIKGLALTFFTTALGNLSFVIIKLGLTLMTLPVRIFGVPIGQASLPFLSKEYKDDDLTNLKNILLESVNQIAFLAFPASALILILRIPVIRIIFGAKNFPWPTTVLTGKVVIILALSIAFQAMIQVLVRGFYALQDTKTPLKISLVSNVFYFLFCAYFTFFQNTPHGQFFSQGLKYLFNLKSSSEVGLIGIALATAISTILELVLYMSYLNKKIPKFIDSNFIFNQFKIIFSSFLMAISLYLLLKILDLTFFDTTRTIELVALTITVSTIGMSFYIYLAKAFQIKELKLILSVFNNFSKKKTKIITTTQEPIADQNVNDDII